MGQKTDTVGWLIATCLIGAPLLYVAYLVISVLINGDTGCATLDC